MESNNTMESSKGSSTGKGRVYEQSFAYPSLSDPGEPIARCSDSYDLPYKEAYGSSYNSTIENPHPPTESSSAPYGAVEINKSALGAPIPTASIREYEYQSEPLSTSNYYNSYTGYDTTTSMTGTFESSDEEDSGSGKSDSKSCDNLSPAPSARSNRTDVNSTIRHQRPPNERYQLPCEFRNLTGCDRVFPGDDVQGWMDHFEDHVQNKLPAKLRCWFCYDTQFKARVTSKGDVRSNFNMRMQHIRYHIVYDGYRPEQMVKDGHLVKHLIDQGIIDRSTYESILNPTTVPRIPRYRHKSKRGGQKNRYVPQVDEGFIAGSSSRHNHRQRDSRWEHNLGQESKRGRQNRNGRSELCSAPGIISIDTAVRRTLVQDLYPSSNMLSTPLEGLRIPNRSTASRDPATNSRTFDDQSIEHASEGNLTSTDANELLNQVTGLERDGSSRSSVRNEPPGSQDDSDDGQSTCPTDASTSESGSFWLAEYSEDENRKLDEDHPFNHFKELAVFKVLMAFHSGKRNLSKEDVPCDGAGESNPTSTQSKGKSKATATGKRTWANKSENNENIDDGSAQSSNRVDCSKRRRTSHRQVTFACPYTKKDPMLYRDCYRYKLSRIRDVKQHLARCHRKPLYCPRCMGTFGTEVERDDHIREFSCPSRRLVTLDGITEYQKSQLAKKSAPNASPEAQWFAVFEIVFPGHRPKPASPYVDSELLQDITLYQDFLTSHGPRILSGILTERGGVTWNLPDGERDLAAFQQTVFEEGFRTVFDQWFARRSRNSQDLTMSSSSESNSHDTPPSSSTSRERVGSTSGHGSGTVTHEGMGALPSGRPVYTLPDSEDISGGSNGQGSFDEGLDVSSRLEYAGDFELPAELSIDELVALMGDDGQVSSEPGNVWE